MGQEDFFDAGHAHVSELESAIANCRLVCARTRPRRRNARWTPGADYLAIGPVYATGTKPSAKPVTLDYVRWAAAHATIPWFAIGGINLQTLDAVLAAGARRICVVSAILNAPDIAQACAEFRRRLE